MLGQLSDMDLRLLQVFKSVAECGGLSAAELELNIGTSTEPPHERPGNAPGPDAVPARPRRLCADARRPACTTKPCACWRVDAFRSSIDDIHHRMGGQLDVAVFDKTASNPAAHIGEAIALFRKGPRREPANARGRHPRHRARADGRELPRGHHPGAPQLAEAWCTACSPKPCCSTAAHAIHCSARTIGLDWDSLRLAVRRAWATTRPTWS
jgi:hypothetical protein